MSAKGYSAGVKEYRETYWVPDYEPRDTDLIACFKVTPQPGIAREEVAAAVCAESSTGTWTTVWTDLLTDLDYYKGRAFRIEDVPGDSEAFYAYVAYPIDLFEEGSIVNVLTSLVGNVFGFKALRSLRLEDIRFPLHYVMTCGGPPNGMQVERDIMNKYGRPLLGCTIKPKLGLSAKNYGRAVYEALRGGLDFTKDDENVNSQPFMRWKQRFDFVSEAVHKAEAETGERKGHYLNVTAPTVEEMYKRAEFAKSLDMRIIMHDFLTAGFTANTSLANWCRDNGILLHIHRAMHAVLDRHPQARHPLPRARQVSAALGWGPLYIPAPWSASSRAIARRPSAGSTSCARASSRRTRAASSSIRTGAPCRACSRSPPAASTSGTCRPWSPSSATMPCSSSVAARSAIPGATPPERRPTGSRSRPASKARNQGVGSMEKEPQGHPAGRRQAQPRARRRDGDLEGDQVRVRHRRQIGRGFGVKRAAI